MRVLDWSQVSTYRNCPLSYYFKYELGIRRQTDGEESHDRNYGKAIHAALEAYYIGKKQEECVGKFKESYPVQLDSEDLAKTRENGELLLAGYFKRYKDDFSKYKVVDVEKRLDFEIEGVRFCAKVDTVVENIKYGGIYSLEHKTTGKTLTYDYWGQYEPNHQLNFQTKAIEANYGQCSGVIIDAMSFGFRKRAYKGEEAGFHMNFERQEFNINKAQQEIWKASTLATVEELKVSRGASSWPMNTTQCRFCSCKEICKAGWTWPEDKDLILLSYEVMENHLHYLEPTINPGTTDSTSESKEDNHAERTRVTNPTESPDVSS